MATVNYWLDHAKRMGRRHGVSIIVWLAAVAMVVWLSSGRRVRFQALGIAQSETRQIASVCTGRVRLMPIRLFDEVRQGQTLAVLEDDQVRSALATASAEVARLRAELAATEARLEADAQNQQLARTAEGRRFATDVETVRLRVLDLTTEIETDRIALADLKLQAEVLQSAQPSDAAASGQPEDVRSPYASLRKRIEEDEAALVQARNDLADAQRRLADFEAQHPAVPSLETTLAPLREAITVQDRRVAELSVERAMLVLTSPMDGTVIAVFRGAGEAVRPGDPLVSVVAKEPTSVLAYLSDREFNEAEKGMRVELVTRADPTRMGLSTVQMLAPAVETKPMQLWRNPAVAEWGRAVLVTVPHEMRLFPGEVVVVRSR